MRKILLALLAFHCCAPSEEPADLILRSGRLYTLDPAREWADAIAIRKETIAAIGSNAEMDRFIGRETAVVELGERLVLPGFNDSHIHFLEGSLYLGQVSLDDARSLQEMQDLVRAYAAEHREDPWVLGRGWIYAYIDGGRLPTRHDLDAVVSDRPVFLEAYDGHTAWVNSKALEKAGVNRRSRPEGYGEVVKDPKSGEPSGILKEEGAMALVRRSIPEPSREEKLNALRRGLIEARRFGITSIQNAHGSPEEIELYEELQRTGELTVRVYSAMSINKKTTSSDLDRFGALKDRLVGPWVKAGAVKIMMDGVIESHTAALLEPYADDPSTSGSPNYTREEIERLILELDRRGFQIFTHAIGDRSVRMVLDAYDKAARASPPRPRRHRIEHIETIAAEDIPRFAALRIIASMQPYHASPDITGVWARNVGRDRQERAFAWKSVRGSGARLIHGSDWPVVSLDPMIGLHAALTREDLDGKPEGGWIPAEKLSLQDAIRGYTIEAAYGSFDEEVKGSLQPGKLADLVVLSDDLFKIPPRKIAEAEVLMTVVGGEAVYISPRFLTEEMRTRLQGRRPAAPNFR